MALDTTHRSGINPYQAPRARVADETVIAQGQPAFFPVSPLKLALMSLVTLSLYEIYWFYKNWKCVQQINNEKLNAPLRAIFYPLTAYWLFRHIREHAGGVEGGVSLQAGLLALGVFGLASLWRLPDPYWLVTYLGFVPLLSVQGVVNKINRKLAPDADPNSRFRGWNIVGLILGGAIFVLAIIGAFLEG